MTVKLPALEDLHKQFDAELAVLQHADANQKVDALFEAKGKTKQHPKAGASGRRDPEPAANTGGA